MLGPSGSLCLSQIEAQPIRDEKRRSFSVSVLNRYALTIAAGVFMASSASVAEPSVTTLDKETAVGKLSIGRAQDAAGRPERPYILTPSDSRVPHGRRSGGQCQKDQHHSDLFNPGHGLQSNCPRFVGKSISVRGRPFPAHTAHHHAPIVMDISAIEPR